MIDDAARNNDVKITVPRDDTPSGFRQGSSSAWSPPTFIYRVVRRLCTGQELWWTGSSFTSDISKLKTYWYKHDAVTGHESASIVSDSDDVFIYAYMIDVSGKLIGEPTVIPNTVPPQCPPTPEFACPSSSAAMTTVLYRLAALSAADRSDFGELFAAWLIQGDAAERGNIAASMAEILDDKPIAVLTLDATIAAAYEKGTK